MATKELDIDGVKIFSRLSSGFLILWAVSFLLSIFIGTIYLGHIPIYGVDRDPYSINSFLLNSVQWINIFSLLGSYLAFFAWPLLIIHQLITKVQISQFDKTIYISTLLSILLFFLFMYIWPGQFLWIYD